MAKKPYSEIKAKPLRIGKKEYNLGKKTYANVKDELQGKKLDFNVLGGFISKDIGIDTLSSDITSLNDNINQGYSSWQKPGWVRSVRGDIGSMQKRLDALDNFATITGNKELSKEIGNTRTSYFQASDNLRKLGEVYGKYESADIYNKETETLSELYSRTEEELRDKYTSDPTGIAYTMASGQQITWQDLYSSALYEEIKEYYDFDEKSKFQKKDVEYEAGLGYLISGKYSVSNEDNHLYNLINKEEKAVSVGHVSDAADRQQNSYSDEQSQGVSQQLTEEEVKVFNYLWETAGPVVAKDFYYSTLKGLSRRKHLEQQAILAEVGKESPVTASLASLVTQQLAAFETVKAAFAYAGTGELPINKMAASTSTMRGTVANEHFDWEVGDWEVGNFLYNTGMSMADSYVASKAFGPAGGVVLGLSAAGSAMNDAKERGLDDDQAFWTGIAAGVFEGLFESVSIGKMKKFKATPVSGFKSGVANAFKSIGVNASEELATEVANKFYDYFANGELSQYEINVRTYMNSGMSESEAREKARWGVVGDLAEAFGSGALMGVGFGGVGATSAYNQSKYLGGNIKDNAKASEVFDIASNPEMKDAYDAYTAYAKKGVTAENATDAQVGALWQNARGDLEAKAHNKKSTGQEILFAKDDYQKLDEYAKYNPESEGNRLARAYTGKENKGNADMLIAEALKMDKGTEAYKIANELRDKKSLTKEDARRLTKAIDVAERAELTKSATEKLTELGEGENASKIADIIVKKAMGDTLTKAEEKTLESSAYGNEVYNQIIAEGAEEEASAEIASEEMVAETSDELVKKGVSADVASLVAQKMKGEALATEDAEAIMKADIDFADTESNVSKLISNAKAMAKGEGALYLAMYDGKTDLDAYTNAYNLVWEKSSKNFTLKNILDTKSVLTGEQASKIYTEARINVDREQTAKFKQIIEKTAKMKAYKGKIVDSVIDYENKSTEGKVNWNDLTSRQRKSIEFIKGFAEATGLNLTLITDGKARGINGAFDINGNEIILDVFAEMTDVDTGKLVDSLVPTLSHELTHWMELKSPELYRKVNTIVFNTLEKHDGLSEDARIAKEVTRLLAKEYKAKYEAENPGKTITIEEAKGKITNDAVSEALKDDKKIDEARSEIVARACEDMLSKSKVGKEIFAEFSVKEQKTIGDMVKELIQKLKDWASELLGLYKSDRYEADVMRKFDEGLDELSKAWDEMLKESVEVNQALEKSGEYKEFADGKAMLSEREIIGVSGTNYGIGVYLDSNLLTGLTEDERKQMVKEYVVTELAGKHFIAYDNNVAVDVGIAKKNDKIKNSNNNKNKVLGELYRRNNDIVVKQEAIVLIDELIANAKYDNSKTPDYSHDWLDNNGKNDWDYWTVFIQEKNKTVWEATLNIANTANGEKILYDIKPIKKVEEGVKSPSTTTKHIVTNPNGNVKQNISNTDSTGRILNSDRDSEYLELAKDPIKNEARLREIVDEAAKKAGYDSPMLYHGTRAFGFTKFVLSKMDDKQSIFLTDNKRIASTYSGVTGVRKTNDIYTNNVDSLTVEDISKELNYFVKEYYKDTFEGADYNYSYYNLEKLNNLIKRVNDGLIDLREEVEQKIKDYADKMASDFDDNTAKTHRQLVLLQERLDKWDYANLSTPIYLLIHHTDALSENSAKYGNLEADIRLMNDLRRNKDIDDGVVVEESLGRYSIEVMSKDEAAEKLKTISQKGNYALYANMGTSLVIDGRGQNWNNIRRWTDALTSNKKKFELVDDGEFYYLKDKETGRTIKEASVDILKTFKMSSNETLEFLIKKYSDILYVKNENIKTTRQIAKFAKENGYDSVLIKNITDNGGQNYKVGMEETADIYIIFDENNVKSADLVTYDDDGNVIPLSERFNKKDEDIRYSERDDTNIYDIMGENERLQKRNERLEADFARLKEMWSIDKKETHRTVYDSKNLLAVAKYVKETFNSNMDKVELARMLGDTYTAIAEKLNKNYAALPWQEVYDYCYNTAYEVVEKAKPRVVVGEYSAGILREIRNTKVSLNELQKAEAKNTYGKGWNKNFMGKVTLAEGVTSLDSQWKEWAREYPNIFDKDTNSNDMPGELLRIVEDLNQAKNVAQEFNRVELVNEVAEEIYNKFWTITPITTTADKYANKIKELKLEHRRAMEQARADHEALVEEQKLADEIHFKKTIAQIRERRDRDVKLAKEHGKAMVEGFKESAERKSVIQSITSISLGLNDTLEKNSKDKHVPEVLKDSLRELLAAINFSSKRMLEGGLPTKNDIRIAEAFKNLRVSVLESETSVEESLIELYGSNIAKETADLAKQIDEISKNLNGKQFILNQISLDNLKTLNNMLKIFRKAINNINKFHTSQRGLSIEEAAIKTTKELKAREKIYNDNEKHFDKLKTKLYWNNLTPYYAYKNMGDTALQRFRAIMDGQDKMAFLSKEVIDFAGKQYTAKEYKAWSEQFFEFKVMQPSGKEAKFSLNVPQIMSLYCITKQEDGKRHVLHGTNGKGGGITIAETKKTRGTTDNIQLSSADLKNILSVLDNKAVGRAKEVADGLQKYMNERGAELGNEVSMARWGIKSFGDIENYFPIKASKGTYKKGEVPGVNHMSLLAILNRSFTHSRNKYADKSVEIGDVFDVFSEHMSEMIQYNAMALPVLDMYKWLNSNGTDENGSEYAVETSIVNTFGDNAIKYIVKFMQDLNGTTKDQTMDNMGVKFFKNAKVAKVALNLRVAGLQYTAYLRAGAVIDNKYLLKALAYKPKIKKAEENCGIALWKSLGYYDTDITKGLTDLIKHDTNWKDTVTEWSLKGAEWGDKLTWGVLWNACELELRETRKDLTPGTKEFDRAVGLRLREVVYRTQVVDSVATKSQMMRGSAWDKMLTSFASENAISFNLASDIFVTTKLDARSMGTMASLKKNGKYMRKAIAAYIATNLVSALIQTAFDVFRNYDEEDDEWAILKMFLENMASNSSIINKLPYFNQITSFLSGFSSSRMETDWMEKTVTGVKQLYKWMFEDGSGEKAFKTLLDAASNATGIGLFNLYRDAKALYNLLFD